MTNDAIGGRAEGVISDDIKNQKNIVEQKQREVFERLFDYCGALVDENSLAADQAMKELDAAAREVAKAERRERQLENTLNAARDRASDLRRWRESIAGKQGG